MGRINVTTYEKHDEVLEEIDEENDAEKVRRCIEAYPRVEKLQAELESKEAKIDELRNQLQAANSRIDASNELVKRVEEQDEDIAETLETLDSRIAELQDQVEDDSDSGLFARVLGR